MPTVREIVQKTTDFFKDKGFESARLDSELLIASALNWERLQVFLKHDYPLSEPELERCRDFVRRRGKGEPVAYILGEKGFYKHVFEVNTATLIPRPETEMLVDRGLDLLTASVEKSDLLVVDLGCGTGCIGISLACADSRVKLVLIDSSQAALEVARRNATKLGVLDRCEFVCGDAGQTDTVRPWIKSAALVVANPPYIEIGDTRVQVNVRTYEPAQALFAEDSGLREIKRWAATAYQLVSSTGSSLFEIGDEQGALAVEIFRQCGWSKVILQQDLSGRERMIEGSNHG